MSQKREKSMTAIDPAQKLSLQTLNNLVDYHDWELYEDERGLVTRIENLERRVKKLAKKER